MLFVNFTVSIIITLLLFTIMIPIIKWILKIFNKYDYKNYYLFLPTFLILGTWSLIFILWYLITTYIFKIDIINLIISLITKSFTFTNNFIFLTLLLIFLGIIVQGICIYLVNIDYNKITGNTRFFIKKVCRFKTKKENSISLKKDPEKISFLSSLLISICIFLTIVICIFVLLLIGKLISSRFILNVKNY